MVRRVGVGIGHAHEEWLLVLPREVVQPLDRLGLHFLVEIELQASEAGAAFIHRAQVVARRVEAEFTFRPVRHPAEVRGVDVGGEPLFEAVLLVRPHEVHLAAEDGLVALLGEVVRERGRGRLELAGVVERADARRELAGKKREARRCAQREIAVGILENGGALGERLQVRRFHDRVAVERQDGGRQLIGHDEQDVGFSHRVSLIAQ